MDSLQHIHHFLLRASVEVVHIENDAIDTRQNQLLLGSRFELILRELPHLGQECGELFKILARSRDHAKLAGVIGALKSLADEVSHLSIGPQFLEILINLGNFLTRGLECLARSVGGRD